MIKRLIISAFSLLILIQFAHASGDSTTYNIDVNSSVLHWAIDAHHGIIFLKKGTIKFQGDKIIAACTSIQMDSVHDQDITYALMRKTLHNVLRSDVFFNTKKYPYSYFVLDEATKLPGGRYLLRGDLDITGVSVCVHFIIHVKKLGKTIKITSEPFKIDRLNWGITSYSTHSAKSEKNFIVTDSINFRFHLFANEKND